MPADINNPPMQSSLPIVEDGATWPKPWGNWLTQAWQALFYGWLWNTKTVTTAYTVQLEDAVILLNGDATVMLPSVRKVGTKRITVKVINAGGGTRTVDGNDGNIDGAASVSTTTQYTKWDFVCDGTNYFIV